MFLSRRGQIGGKYTDLMGPQSSKIKTSRAARHVACKTTHTKMVMELSFLLYQWNHINTIYCMHAKREQGSSTVIPWNEESHRKDSKDKATLLWLDSDKMGNKPRNREEGKILNHLGEAWTGKRRILMPEQQFSDLNHQINLPFWLFYVNKKLACPFL